MHDAFLRIVWSWSEVLLRDSRKLADDGGCVGQEEIVTQSLFLQRCTICKFLFSSLTTFKNILLWKWSLHCPRSSFLVIRCRHDRTLLLVLLWKCFRCSVMWSYSSVLWFETFSLSTNFCGKYFPQIFVESTILSTKNTFHKNTFHKNTFHKKYFPQKNTAGVFNAHQAGSLQ